MASRATWSPPKAKAAADGSRSVRPRLSFADYLLYFWRTKWLILLFVLPVLALTWLLAVSAPTQYEAKAKLIVIPGPEKVLRISEDMVITGPANTHQDTMSREVDLLQAKPVAEQTLARFPLQRVYPRLEEARQLAYAASQTRSERERIEAQALSTSMKHFARDFRVHATPTSSVISVSYIHTDPDVAIEVLNAALAIYQDQRASLLNIAPESTRTTQRKSAQRAYLEAKDALRRFNETHKISDFVRERVSAEGLSTNLTTEVLKLQARQSALAREQRTVRTQIETTPQSLDVPFEDNRLADLESLQDEREEALTIYKTESQRVQSLDQDIEALRRNIETQNGPEELTRSIPNPAYQTLETDLKRLEAEAAGLVAERASLQTQLDRVDAKREALLELEPEWQALQLDLTQRQAALQTILHEEQKAASSPESGEYTPVTVKLLDPATKPVAGRNYAVIIWIVGTIAAIIGALGIGRLFAHRRRSFATPGALARTLSLPVLTGLVRG